MRELLTLRPEGLWCEAGGFFVDPWRPVARAVVTHAHADHARPGNGVVIGAQASLPLLRRRLGTGQALEGVPYGERRVLGDVEVSFHPAGHVLGSAQVRVSDGRTVWVVSGDYKRAEDPTCAPFEVVPCDVFITEATFGLPVYRWPSGAQVAAQVLEWWNACRARGVTAVLLAYALGKSQRLLAELARLTDAPVRTHGAVEALVRTYREAGVKMLPTVPLAEDGGWKGLRDDLVIAPPSVCGTPALVRLARAEVGFASGWMQVRGARRRKGVERGFVLSDHADWDGLVRTCVDTGARRVLVTHGSAAVLSRFLRERGLDAAPLAGAAEAAGWSEGDG
jgi:putative mRNA 3-end processing factor